MTVDYSFSDEFQQILFEQSPDGIMIDDGTGRYVNVNKTLCDWLNYTREEFLKLTVEELIDPKSLTREPLKLNEMKDGKTVITERPIKCKDASYLPVEFTARLLLNGHYLIHVRDITKRKKIEQGLHERERMFTTLVSNLPGIVFRCRNDKNWTMEYVSDECYNVTGYHPDDFINNKVLSFNDIIHPNFREIIWDEWQEALKKKETFENEYQIITAWNEIRWVWERGIGIFSEGGELLFLEGFISDITRSKNAAAKLQEEHNNLLAIKEASPIGLLVLDENKQIIDANPEAARIFQTELEDLQHRFCGNFIGCVNRDTDEKGCGYSPQCKACKLMLTIDEVLFSNKGVHERETETLLETDIGYKKHWIRFNIEPVLLNGRRHIVVASSDITGRIEAEELVKRLNAELDLRVIERTDQLQEANKEMEAFAYSIAHDLRAPLRAIDGYTQIVSEDYESLFDDEGKRILSIIRSNAQRMGQLIDDLLALSRLSRKELHFTIIDMKSMFLSIINEIQTLHLQQKTDLDLNSISPAYGDPILIKQVMTNLITNALKFSSHRERITLSFSSKAEPHRVVFCMKDNGAGFDMNYVSKLFNVFQRLHSVTEFEGTGIGLAIVHRIISRHGGEVWAEGAVDQGASFYFTLPRKRGILET